MPKAELNDCPMCGSKARLSRQSGYGTLGARYCREYVYCSKRRCIRTDLHKRPGAAVEVWNTRK